MKEKSLWVKYSEKQKESTFPPNLAVEQKLKTRFSVS